MARQMPHESVPAEPVDWQPARTHDRISTMIGQKFGRLTVIERAPNKSEKPRWKCACECGGSTISFASSLRRGRARSCGCLKIEMFVARKGELHYQSRTPEYSAWSHMVQRCTNPSSKSYKHYGARGITVCERWRTSFVDFLADMGKRPTNEHSLDRIDNDQGYEPGNCRWATIHTQNTNKRQTSKMLTAFGVTKSIPDWGRERNLLTVTIRYRLAHGYTPEEAVASQSRL